MEQELPQCKIPDGKIFLDLSKAIVAIKNRSDSYAITKICIPTSCTKNTDNFDQTLCEVWTWRKGQKSGISSITTGLCLKDARGEKVNWLNFREGILNKDPDRRSMEASYWVGTDVKGDSLFLRNAYENESYKIEQICRKQDLNDTDTQMQNDKKGSSDIGVFAEIWTFKEGKNKSQGPILKDHILVTYYDSKLNSAQNYNYMDLYNILKA